MPQTVGFRSIALFQPNQDIKEKMKKKPNHKWKSASRPPRAPRQPTSPLERAIAARVTALKDADPDLFSKALGVLKCELAVEFLKITDMEFGIEGSLKTGDRKFCFHCFCC